MVAVLYHVIHKQSFVDPTEVGAQDIELLVGLSVCLYVYLRKFQPPWRSYSSAHWQMFGRCGRDHSALWGVSSCGDLLCPAWTL